MSKKRKVLLWILSICVLVTALVTVLWLKTFRTYTPAAVTADIRAGIAVRHLANPVPQFLELRYGPLSEPENRQKAFLDFFEVGHIEGLYLLVSHMKGDRRENNINNMAQWIAAYRTNMSVEERESLRDYIKTEAGKKKVYTATAHYLKSNVGYRSATAPVIRELMTTLAAVDSGRGNGN